jgi:hypothetical protein
VCLRVSSLGSLSGTLFSRSRSSLSLSHSARGAPGYENRTDQSESPLRSLLGPRAFRWVGVWDLPSSEEFCMILDGRTQSCCMHPKLQYSSPRIRQRVQSFCEAPSNSRRTCRTMSQDNRLIRRCRGLQTPSETRPNRRHRAKFCKLCGSL